MKGLVKEEHLQDIANAIREKNGTETTYKPSEMASAIRGIEVGGGEVKESPNLLVYPYTSIKTGEVAGVTITDNGDGSITLNGTTTSELELFVTSPTTLIENETYIFDIGAPDDFYNNLIFYELNFPVDGEIRVKVPFVPIQSNNSIDFIMLILPGITFDNLTLYPNLNKGTELKPWQPYQEPEFYFTNHGSMYKKNHIVTTNHNDGFYGSAYRFADKMETVEVPYLQAHWTGQTYVFAGCTSLKSAILPRIMKIGTQFFADCPLLEYVVLGSEEYPMNSISTNIFMNDPSLKHIEIVGVINETFNVRWSPLLSDASVQNIIDVLADLTGQTAKVITFHADVFDKLTDEQKATITSKNWTLVRG